CAQRPHPEPMSRMFEFALASFCVKTNIQKSRACVRKCTWLLMMRLPTPIRTRRWFGGRSRNSDQIRRGTISKALMIVRNKGLKVSRDVDGNSLRMVRSSVEPLASVVFAKLAEVSVISFTSQRGKMSECCDLSSLYRLRLCDVHRIQALSFMVRTL